MNTHLKLIMVWLLTGPVLALLISFISWLLFDYFSPDKLHDLSNLVTLYPLGLLMSLLTPWGWLMYGGLMLQYSGNSKMGFYCTLCGALALGCFWPIWSMELAG